MGAVICSWKNRLKRLGGQLPKGELRLDEATCGAHAGDKWFAAHLPDAVAMPRSVRSVATVLKFASRHTIPVTVRGVGSVVMSGGACLRAEVLRFLWRA